MDQYINFFASNVTIQKNISSIQEQTGTVLEFDFCYTHKEEHFAILLYIEIFSGKLSYGELRK